LYSFAVRVLKTDVASLSSEEQQQFFGQPVSLFDFDNSSPADNGGGTTGGNGGGTTAPVPLPAAGWLFLSALGGLAVLRRRRNKAHAA